MQLWAILATQRGMSEDSESSSHQVATDQQKDESNSSQDFRLPQHKLMNRSCGWRVTVSLSEGGRYYMTAVFGVAGISLCLLLIDSIFCLI